VKVLPTSAASGCEVPGAKDVEKHASVADSVRGLDVDVWGLDVEAERGLVVGEAEQLDASAATATNATPKPFMPGTIAIRSCKRDPVPVSRRSYPAFRCASMYSSQMQEGETQLPGSNERSHRSRTIALVVGLVVVVGFLGYGLVQPAHAGGDPGGSIMQSVKQTMRSSLPRGAHVTRASSQEPHWTPACGWSEVFATLSFTSDQSPDEVVRRAGSVLTAAGWSKVTYPANGGGLTTWTHEVAHARVVKRIDLTNTATAPTNAYTLSIAAPPQSAQQGNCPS
jgi:hypothetical protein